jgi:hypothetical protein
MCLYLRIEGVQFYALLCYASDNFLYKIKDDIKY